MAARSSILAWRIPWTEDPGKLQSMVLQRVHVCQGSQGALVVKNLPANAGETKDKGSIPG